MDRRGSGVLRSRAAIVVNYLWAVPAIVAAVYYLIALAAALGVPSSPKSGGVAHGIVYIVFPGSAQGWPLSQPEIDQYGAQLFAKWGGLDKAKDCFPNSEWSS